MRCHRMFLTGRRACSNPVATCRYDGGDLCAFTLVEVLVVITILGLLMAIFFPVARRAREQGQRAVCLSNLRQLTIGWIGYADDYDGRLVCGGAFYERRRGPIRKLKGWVGRAFWVPESRDALMDNPDKGTLWPYLQDVDLYRCPRGWMGHAVTYTTVVAANGMPDVEGTIRLDHTQGQAELTEFGARVGTTVLKLTRLTDIVHPGASERAVFVDKGHTPTSSDFHVHYMHPKWTRYSPPPIHHAAGLTMSMADGHAEYWKWKGHETVSGLPRTRLPVRHLFSQILDGGDYEPETEDGLYDLQRLQRATWGRLGYSIGDRPP